jgi:hypothetical protein
MKYRKLRVAWSVAWNVVAVLFVALWVLSYSETDSLQGLLPTGKQYTVLSTRGRIFAAIFKQRDRTPSLGFMRSGPETYEVQIAADNKEFPYGFGKRFRPDLSLRQIIFPHWFVIICCATFSALPWFRWRFRPRTLLIATTFVAVVLGLIVWLFK